MRGDLREFSSPIGARLFRADRCSPQTVHPFRRRRDAVKARRPRTEQWRTGLNRQRVTLRRLIVSAWSRGSESGAARITDHDNASCPCASRKAADLL
jgi:hypothetical protein